jgi:DNA-directed RNA polymerase specialized sigma24 family protein
MMTPEQLLPHLPHLRRYARLLTGEQPAGDAMVERMLEYLLSIRGRPDVSGSTSIRTALYRSLVRVLSEHGGPIMPTICEGVIDERLKAMDPVAREVFLLVNVEQFSLAEAAEILDMTPAEVANHLEAAGSDIARQIATSVLIIEDEPLIALAIENIVTDMGHAVVGIAHTKSEALSIVGLDKPGLILADIQLADGSSGIEAVSEIVAGDTTPAIFITAFPERVLTGMKPEPAFLIAKPFQAEQVKAVVSQTLFVRG